MCSGARYTGGYHSGSQVIVTLTIPSDVGSESSTDARVQWKKDTLVFVSSTYADLQDERQEVMQALLELDCIPAGMELFPAANEDQWTLIKKVIDDCDYYIVIIAGRYGSLGSAGQSYTEMEYRYAVEQGKPVIGFIHREPESLPANRCEKDQDARQLLETFRSLVKTKMCRFWDSPADLGSQVSRSLVKLIKAHPAVGWVKADLVPTRSSAEEILRLKRQIDELKGALEAVSSARPAEAIGLAQGDDKFSLSFAFDAENEKGVTKRHSERLHITWNQLFAAISPVLLSEVTDIGLTRELNAFVAVEGTKRLRNHPKFGGKDLSDFRVAGQDYQTIKVQLLALGLMQKAEKPRSLRDRATYWTLTGHGERVMHQLRAIRRDTP